MYVRRRVCGVVLGSGGRPCGSTALGRERRRLADDLGDALATDSSAAGFRTT